MTEQRKSIRAPDFLKEAANIMEERAREYDQPGGERSIPATVAAFNAITGRGKNGDSAYALTEAEGWLFMQILKDVRLFSAPGFHVDSAKDCVAYAALKAEAKSTGS